MCAPQRLRFRFAEADMVEFPLLLEDDHVPNRLLDRAGEVNACGLEHVDLLRSPQRGITRIDARPNILNAIGPIACQSHSHCERRIGQR